MYCIHTHLHTKPYTACCCDHTSVSPSLSSESPCQYLSPVIHHPPLSPLIHLCLSRLFVSLSSHLSAVQEAASVASGHLAQSPINETARCFSLFDSPLLSVCTLQPAEHTNLNQQSMSKEQPGGRTSNKR